jgi:single-stranded-DNA-specific exonuclease
MLPAARCSDAKTMGEDDKHLRFTVTAGGSRARAVAFATTRIDCDHPLDATFSLELNEYNGSVEPRLVLKDARPSAPPPITLVGEPADYLGAAFAEATRDLDDIALRPRALGAPVRDRRGMGIAGTIAALVAAGEPVLVVAADAVLRLRHLQPILGGFALCSHDALERDPALVGAGADRLHVVMLDPPAAPLRTHGRMTHLTWGQPELRFAEQIHEREYALRASLTATYRALRAAGDVAGEELETLLRGDAKTPRPAQLAGRVLRVLAELQLVSLDPVGRALTVPPAERTALERSAAFRAYQQRYEDGQRFLSEVTAKAA